MPPKNPEQNSASSGEGGITDEELMARVQQGDAQAYEVLFNRHQARVYGYLLRKTRDAQIAADLYQETFLRVYRSRHTWQSPRPVKPWIFGIAVNASRDHARKVRRFPEETELAPSLEAPATANPTARVDIEQAIGQLPENLRDAFLLGAVEGFDHREVAAQLNISPDNARARISRARSRLREILGGAE